MRKLYEIFKLLWIQKRIVAAATIWGNTVYGCSLGNFEAMQGGAKFHISWKIKINKSIYLFFRYLWPWGKWSALSHDAYTCLQFPRTSPWPTQRKMTTNNFVASVVSANDILKLECPMKCRPKEHQDWKYC